MSFSVLVVDDDDLTLETINDMLSSMGLRCIKCPNAEVALESLEQQQPSVALVDIVMPGTDGLQLITLLQERKPSLKIVAMSGDGNASSYFRALHYRGIENTLTKPIGLEQLKATLSKVTGIDVEDLGEDLIG